MCQKTLNGARAWVLQMLCLFAALMGVVGFAHAAEDKQEAADPTYRLGSGDQLRIWALAVDELSKAPFRVDEQGKLDLPMVGQLQAAGLTVAEVKAALIEKLKKYVIEPDVTVSLEESASQPVSVIGAVTSPGIYQLKGKKRLIEVLSLAGGLRQDAGHSIKVTRASSKFPAEANAVEGEGQSVLSVPVKDVMEASSAAGQVVVQPGDVISVPRAQLVYVIGTVRKPGGFVLNERESLSVLQALSMAEGLDRTASPKNARILRMEGTDTQRTEIPVDLNKILAGRSQDVPMRPDDILFVPNSLAKSASMRTLEAAIQITTGIIIWRR